jgi:hypothetical protein
MSSRQATDAEVDKWRTDGWVVLEGLIGTDEIDAAGDDLWQLYPTPEQFHADPDGEAAETFRSGSPLLRRVRSAATNAGEAHQDQFVGMKPFPVGGSGTLDALAVHPSIIDFMERALETTDLRLYQGQTWAKYAGNTDYSQFHHTDRNHSFLPAQNQPPYLHVEGFLFLSDIIDGVGPTHVVSKQDDGGRSIDDRYSPDEAPEFYAAEQKATGVRGSFLAYRSDVFHRGVDLTTPGGSRFLFNISYKIAGNDWIGYHTVQSRSTGPEWTQFVERCTPRQLELFGFPAPGHPIWTWELVERTAKRYPGLDMTPWRKGLPA